MFKFIIPENKHKDGIVYRFEDLRNVLEKHMDKRLFYVFTKGEGFKLKVMDKYGYFDHEVLIYTLDPTKYTDMFNLLKFMAFTKSVWVEKPDKTYQEVF